MRREVVASILVITFMALSACSSQRHAHTIGPATGATRVVGQSWSLCRWLGPGANRPGLYGSDLGYTVPFPTASGVSDQLELLFGDTWAQPTDACQYPVLKNDDFQARIPLQRPASLTPGEPAAESDACNAMQYPLQDSNDPTSWRRMRVFPDAGERNDDRALDTGMDRTPVATWNDGTHTFVYFIRGEYATCQTSDECPTAMACTRDANYAGKHIGSCQPKVSLNSDTTPDLCRNDDDCSSPATCGDLGVGLCVATQPFTVQRDGQSLSPSWYDDDPRRGAAWSIYLTSEFWADRPEDLATGARFTTNKFMNATARTVTHFDPEHPENNDYTPGQETLLLWGRPAFTAGDGFQAMSFLLYQPLAGMIDEHGAIAWNPRYFAGYDDAGNPAWSDKEADALPIYGVDENLVKQDGQWTWSWQSPEFDYVNQMSTVWVAPLQRWVMLYGGETPATVDPVDGKRPPPTYAQRSPGAIHLRSARHPFGRAHASSPNAEAYSAALPVLTRLAIKDQLACDDDAKARGDCNPKLPKKPGNLFEALASTITDDTKDNFVTASAKCTAGAAVLDTQNSLGDDSEGHLYGTAIIEQWTQELTGDDPGAEIYWNVSTWNPYQVLLMKTQLHESDLRDGR